MKVFLILAEVSISVDFIDIKPEQITFIINSESKRETENLLRENCFNFELKENYSKVSIVGSGMAKKPRIGSCYRARITGIDGVGIDGKPVQVDNSPGEGYVQFDFTDESLTDYLSAYLNKQLSAIIKEANFSQLKCYG